MVFKVRKSFKIAPGVRVNVSNRGVSTSVGTKGARVTVGRDRTTTTLGIPGTGISHQQVNRHESDAPAEPEPTAPRSNRRRLYVLLALFIAALLLVVATTPPGRPH